MIDIVLMDALLQALPPRCRLILLGDHHQLASVEAGSLFGDLCAKGTDSRSAQLCAQLEQLTGKTHPSTTQSPSAPGDSVITLRTSYRFAAGSGIGSLAAAVNNGDKEKIAAMPEAPPSEDIQFCTLQGSRRRTWLEKHLSAGFEQIHRADSPEAALTALECFRCLCATRKGPSGVEEINNLTRQILARRGLVPREDIWYKGQPLIIRRNRYDMQLFNGDTGIVWPDETGMLMAWFMRPDNRLQPFSPAGIPEHDTAYAVTIHKAQGSEFDRVLLLLPEEESRVLSRELVYTGITRARSYLTVCAETGTLLAAAGRKTLRFSGLADKLHAKHQYSVPPCAGAVI
jgi:exodeoxyribonuclease V alpha subunit